jgi:hypothetical protein
MKSIDQFIEDLEIIETEEIDALPKKAITIWLPEDKTEKFADLQRRSKRKFGKKIQELLVQVIDSVNVGKPA